MYILLRSALRCLELIPGKEKEGHRGGIVGLNLSIISRERVHARFRSPYTSIPQPPQSPVTATMPTTTVTSTNHRALQSIADTIYSSKRILVITGAGISTNSGIPDFRSTHGLYNLVKSRYPPSISSNSISAGKDLFNSSLFTDPTSTSIFYSFLAELRERVLRVKDTTPTHKFIRTLAESGRLLRCYTQNIDGLEGREGLATDLSLGAAVNSKKRKRYSIAGVPGEMALSETAASPGVSDDMKGEVVTAPKRGCQVVQLHGELDTLRCMHCQGTCEYDNDRVAALMDGRAPDCPSCVFKDRERREAGKRGTRVGGLRPNIVLYDEEHPQGDVIGRITSADLKSGPDMMIIFGTSLKVHGLKRLVKEFAASIHARNAARKSSTSAEDGGKEITGDGKPAKQETLRVVFVNNQPAANSVWKDTIDAWVDMDCDEFVAEIKHRRPAVWERQERLEAGFRRIVEGKAGSGKGGAGAKVVKGTSASSHNLTPVKAGKAQTPPEESDKENSSSPTRSPSRAKPRGVSKSATCTPWKKTPLVSASKSSSNSNNALVVATPKHRKTPLPTPPSSISKPRGSERSKNFTGSPSMSPLSSLASTPSLPGTPTRVSLRSFQFECVTPSRLRYALSAAAADGDDDEEEGRTPSKRRKMDDGIEGTINSVQRRLFDSPKWRAGNLLQAVVINSPTPTAITATAASTFALAEPETKKSTTPPIIATAVVQSTITTRSKVTKAAVLSALEFGKGPRRGKTAIVGKIRDIKIDGSVDTDVKSLLTRIEKTWRVGERRSERRRSGVI